MARTKSPSPSETEVLRAVRAYRQESEEARRTRMKKNRLNWDMYFGNQDWSNKQKGQSTEFLPKVSGAAEQMAAFVKRALVQFGDWFSMDLPQGSILTPEQARAMLRIFLENMAVGRNDLGSFYTLVSDAVKQGLMESLIVFKVHGQYMMKRGYRVEPANLLAGIPERMAQDDHTVWRLRIDLIPGEDYYPDPTTRRLYEIHRVERDWFDVMESAERGLYDKKAVQGIREDFERHEEARRKARHRGQDETTPLASRHRVVIDEMWGTILGPDGRPVEKDIVTAVANDKYLIRPPESMRDVFWHGTSPMVAAPIIRVPHSVHHKSLYDDASQLNLALNELYNLILDAGISKVWGIRQVRSHWLQDPRQVSDGIPAGATLVVDESAPAEAKVVESVVTGDVPNDALNVLNLTDREFQAAAKTNDTRLGFLPPRTVKATEVLAAEQGSSVIIDGFANDLETDLIAPTLKKAWMTVVQFMDSVPTEDVVKAIGVDAAFRLSRMSPAQRYAALGHSLDFKVMGLSSTLARARDFQKFMALQQGLATNPVLLEAFIRRISPDKTLDHLMRSLAINPESMQQSPEEQQQLPDRMQRIAVLQQMMPQRGGSPPAVEQGSMQSEINQGAVPQQEV